MIPGTDIECPDEEAYILKKMMQLTRDQLSGEGRSQIMKFRLFFDLPLLWSERIIEEIATITLDNVSTKKLFQGLRSFLYGTNEKQIRLLFNVFDCNRSHYIELEEFRTMLAHLPRDLVILVFSCDSELRESYRILNIKECGEVPGLLPPHKQQKMISKISETLIRSYSKTPHKALGLDYLGFKHFALDNPSMLTTLLWRFRWRLATFERRYSCTYTSEMFPSKSEMISEDLSQPEQYSSVLAAKPSCCPCFRCNQAIRRKAFLDIVYRRAEYRTELAFSKKLGEKPTSCIAFGKEDCLLNI